MFGANPQVGMVIPAWYPDDAVPGLVDTLLTRTLDGVEQYCLPENVVLVLDGQERWQEAVQGQATARGHHYRYLPTNLGKGAAVAAGIEALDAANLRLIVTRDSDADHLINDLPSLLDLAELMDADTGNDLLIVSGGRGDRVRPLGFERAEYEQVTDRVLWQALQYHAARDGRVLSGIYFAPHGDWPDIQSGYKIYSAAAARMAAAILNSACQGSSDGGLSRCGVETLPAVVILSLGGEIGQVSRRTYQEQPVSGYRGLDTLRMYAEPLLWALRRLQIPGEVAATMLDDALLRSPLLFDHSRREKALSVRLAVLAGLGNERPLNWGARFF
jgi:hypothetical protein